jgi:nucleoside-diphosphate-sugar epimerase
VTGAAGRIGSYFAENSQGKYELRLMIQGSEDAENIEKIKPLGEVVTASLDELDKLKELCAGIDTVVHMAGDPSPSATWQELLDANIIGTYNILWRPKRRLPARDSRLIHSRGFGLSRRCAGQDQRAG